MAMPRMHPLYRTVAVDAVIVQHGKVLVMKRNRFPWSGSWVIPGGRVEMNETCEQAVVREAKEETGLKVKIKRFLGVFSSPQRDPRGTVAVAFLCAPVSGKLTLCKDEASEIKWVPFQRLPARMGFDHKTIIRAAKAAKPLN